MKRLMVFIMLFMVCMADTVPAVDKEVEDVLNLPPKAAKPEEFMEELKKWTEKVEGYIKKFPVQMARLVADKSVDVETRTLILELMSRKEIKDYVNTAEVADIFISILEDKTDTKRIRGKVVGLVAFMGKTNSKARDAVIDVLNHDESIYMQGKAAVYLGGVKETRAVPHMINALRKWEPKIGPQLTSEESQVIGGLISALGRMDDSSAASTLTELLKNKSKDLDSSDLKRAVYSALGDLGTMASEAVPILLEELNTVSREYRGILIENLGKTKDKRAVDALIKELDGRDSYDRMQAAEALGTIGDPEAIEGIKKLLARMEKEGRKNDNWAFNKVKESYKKLTGQEYQRGQK